MQKREKEPTQRSIKAQETRSLVFETALELFSKHGFDNVSVDEITQSAGVSKGSFYNYFKSKESVIAEQFKKIDDYYDKTLSDLPPEVSAKTYLMTLVGAMTYFCANICGIDFMRVVYASQTNKSSTTKFINNKERRLYYHLRQAVAIGRKSGEVLCPLPDEEVVELLARSARALIYDWCIYGGELDLETEGRRYFKIIIAYLARSLPKE